MTRRRRGGNKRGESKLASNHFPMCSPQSGPLRGVHGVTEKKRGRKETEVARGRNGGIKRRETDAASYQFLIVGGIGRVAFQGFLVREARISVLVGGAGFILSGVQ